MNTGYITFLIVGAIFIMAFVIPWLIHYRKKREKEKLLKNFSDFTEKNHLSLEKYQTLNRNVIGIDRQQQKLVFMEGTNHPLHTELVDLREIASCKVSKLRNKNTGYITRIFLKIIFKDKEKDYLLLPFYNESTDKLFRMMRLSKKALYWQKSIELFREPNTRIITTSQKKGSL